MSAYTCVAVLLNSNVFNHLKEGLAYGKLLVLMICS